MNSILESQVSISDFKKSINLVSNNIEEVCSSKIDKVVSNTSKEKNFSPKNVTFEISGICDKCMS